MASFLWPTPPVPSRLSGTSLGIATDLGIGYHGVDSTGLLGKEPLAQGQSVSSVAAAADLSQAPTYAARSQAFRLFYHLFP